MPALLPQTFNEVATLPGEQQEAFARWVLDELRDEGDWRVALDKTVRKLAEFQGGSTQRDFSLLFEPQDGHKLH